MAGVRWGQGNCRPIHRDRDQPTDIEIAATGKGIVYSILCDRLRNDGYICTSELAVRNVGYR